MLAMLFLNILYKNIFTIAYIHTVSLKGLVHQLNDVLSNSAVLCTIKKKFKKPISIIFNPSFCTVYSARGGDALLAYSPRVII